MEYYSLAKEDREIIKERIEKTINSDINHKEYKNTLMYSSDDDTYIRKNVYLAIGKLYKNVQKQRGEIISMLRYLYLSKDEKVRQTVVYSLGEIGKVNFEDILELLEKAFSDEHHSVLNALTGALKQLGEKNPLETIEFIKNHLQQTTTKVRIKLLHGLELRGRTHPEDILPILAEYRNDPEKKIVETVIHIIGQISYKEGCLKKVINILKEWEEAELTKKVIKEILTVHQNYSRFSCLSYEEAQDLINKEFHIA